MRMQIYRHLQRLDLRFYDRNPVGRLMTRVTTDVDVINDLFTSGVVSIFGDVFTLAGIMIVMLTMNWKLALVAFAVLPLIVVITQWFRRNVRESYRTVRRLIARINAYLQEHITGMPTVQLFRREARAYQRFDAINENTVSPTSIDLYYAALSGDRDQRAGVGATIWAADSPCSPARWTLGSLVAFLISAAVLPPVSDMSEVQHPAGAWPRRARFKPSTSRSASVTRRVTGACPVARAEDPRTRAHRLRSRLVRLHPTDAQRPDYVLRDVSFEVKRERLGIVVPPARKVDADQPAAFSTMSRRANCRRSGDVGRWTCTISKALLQPVLQDVHPFAGRSPRTTVRRGEIGESACGRRPPRSTRTSSSHVSLAAMRRRSPNAAPRSVGAKAALARARLPRPAHPGPRRSDADVDTETEILIRDALHVLMSAEPPSRSPTGSTSRTWTDPVLHKGIWVDRNAPGTAGDAGSTTSYQLQ